MNRGISLVLRSWCPLIACLMLAYFLSSQDGTNFPDLNRFNLDKLAHFIEFSVMAFLSMRAISRSWPRLGVMGAFIFTVIGLVLFAASDERHQLFVPNRDCSFFDFIFDFMGTSAGILIFTHKAEEADEVARELSSKIKGIIT